MKSVNQLVKLSRTSAFNFKRNVATIAGPTVTTATTTITTIPTYSKTCN
jgi:hypothetical protein